MFPPVTGLRVGTGEVSHVILEIHYDNPSLDADVTDSMGFEAYYVRAPTQRNGAKHARTCRDVLLLACLWPQLPLALASPPRA